MIINLDYQNRTPIYEQIVIGIERYVALKILKPGDKIPSIRELASDIGINPNTVKKAYTMLEIKGVITTISTKGTYISNNINKVIENKINDNINKIRDIISELEKLGLSKEKIIKRL